MATEQKKQPVSLPAAAILAEIHERRRSTMVIASGMGSVLAMLEAYVLHTEARVAALEGRRHEG